MYMVLRRDNADWVNELLAHSIMTKTRTRNGRAHETGTNASTGHAHTLLYQQEGTAGAEKMDGWMGALIDISSSTTYPCFLYTGDLG